MIREARKIVEAKLNEALNKNDAKAVREACIVLKAITITDEAEYEVIVEQGLDNNETEGTIVQKLIDQYGLSKEEAFDIYWKAKNDYENKGKEVTTPKVTEEVKTEEIVTPEVETPVE